jgi:hypothetical protein
MHYLKQVGTFVSLGTLMLGLVACGGKKKAEKGAEPTPTTAPATQKPGEAPKK